MKKISIILACVIVAICTVVTSITSDDTVTAEATEGVAAASAALTTTETTAEQESKTTKKSSNLQIKKVKPYTRYIKVRKSNVRKTPSKKAKIVTTYTKGKKLTVTATCGNWRKVGKSKWIHKDNLSKKNLNKYYNGIKLKYSAPYNIVKNPINPSMGLKRYNGRVESYYSTREYGQNVTARKIPGKHVAKDGTIRDKDGYICVATARNYISIGTRLMTSLGPAKVYDICGIYGRVDIYTNWPV